MEKRKPHCSLERVKAFVAEGMVRASTVAFSGARALGIDDIEGMCEIVLALTMRNFYKSMTSYETPKVWQDVYRTRTQNGHAVYLKLSVVNDVLIVSFKEL